MSLTRDLLSLRQCSAFFAKLSRAWPDWALQGTALALLTCGLRMNILLEQLRVTEIRLNRRDRKLADKVLGSTFPSQLALNSFVDPVTNWSQPSNIPNVSSWLPRIHDVKKITDFCIDTIGWNSAQALSKFHEKLWPGIIIRVLCSGVNDMIRVTFSTADFMKLAHLTASSRTNVRVQVPVPIIASATRQAHKIVGLAGRLGPHPPLTPQNINAVVSFASTSGSRLSPIDLTSEDDLSTAPKRIFSPIDLTGSTMPKRFLSPIDLTSKEDNE
ncbi:hypothetical protein BT96DRAFT_975187 [Gymnopus androsaceus JB14]|uniref:Uncharacterized protein n=1 Tax=Gymnopus androsaceus JB14 TaxID=1447944 RepID=A0A6A4HSH4_9AGAR|nr:hypothetical protein BT96DRAFT_975187 [Gymnopus androsaceus JB14]